MNLHDTVYARASSLLAVARLAALHLDGGSSTVLLRVARRASLAPLSSALFQPPPSASISLTLASRG